MTTKYLKLLSLYNTQLFHTLIFHLSHLNFLHRGQLIHLFLFLLLLFAPNHVIFSADKLPKVTSLTSFRRERDIQRLKCFDSLSSGDKKEKLVFEIINAKVRNSWERGKCEEEESWDDVRSQKTTRVKSCRRRQNEIKAMGSKRDNAVRS